MTREEMRRAIRPLMSEERYRHSLGRLSVWRAVGEKTPKRRQLPESCTIAARKCLWRKRCKS